MDLDALKKNHKTSYLAEMYEKLVKEEEETQSLIVSNPDMAVLAQDEIESIKIQKEAIEKQIEAILASEKEEEEFPNEIVLEVRSTGIFYLQNSSMLEI